MSSKNAALAHALGFTFIPIVFDFRGRTLHSSLRVLNAIASSGPNLPDRPLFKEILAAILSDNARCLNDAFSPKIPRPTLPVHLALPGP